MATIEPGHAVYREGESESKPVSQASWRSQFVVQPSIKYTPIDPPSAVILSQATKAPAPCLPRKVTRKEWCSRSRDKYPLTSSLTSAGRAGKYGELVGKDGGRYMGEVLAGRPHGCGQYFIPLAKGSTRYVLKYDGEWFQGLKHGDGTQYYASGEVYTGGFVTNTRQGYGRLEYRNGDAYEGQWEQDRRNGRGQFFYANGDIFEGHFLNDSREGLGSLLRLSQGLKHVSEYVHDKPRCGTVLKINAPEIFPLTGSMRDTISAVKQRMTAAQLERVRQANPLPALQLRQPSKVLAKEMVKTRRGRRVAGGKVREALESSGTHTDTQLEMLKHSYVLLAGGDEESVGLLPSQLREVAVMADLDPTDPGTEELLHKLAGVCSNFSDRRIHMDDFLRIVSHFTRRIDDEAPGTEQLIDLFPAGPTSFELDTVASDGAWRAGDGANSGFDNAPNLDVVLEGEEGP